MFQNRRTVFLFVCSIVFVQALYYIATLQIKKNETPIVKSTSIAIGTTYSNQSSDRSELSVHKIFNTSNLTQVSLWFEYKSKFSFFYSRLLLSLS